MTEATSTTTYRLLTPEEFSRLQPIFAQYHAVVPRSEFAQCAVAEKDGEIVGFLFLQPAIHVEPLWIKPGAPVGYLQLVRMVEGTLPAGVPVFAFAASLRVAAMAEKAGYKEVDYKVLTKTTGS